MIYEQLPAVEEAEGIAPDAIPEWVFERNRPLVLRGLVKSWPAMPSGDADFDDDGCGGGAMSDDLFAVPFVATGEINALTDVLGLKVRFGVKFCFSITTRVYTWRT